MLKKILVFIICLAIWFVAFLVPLDYSYYQSLVLPSFAPPKIFFPIAWSITYFLIAISMTDILTSYKFKNIPTSYKLSWLINYIFNQSFILVFFGLKSTLLGFISSVGNFISSLFLYQESNELKEKSTLALRPYVLLNIFAIILSLAIYLLNI